MILCKFQEKQNSESQMGFEPTTQLCDLVGCCTAELLGTLWCSSKSQIVVIDWNRIAWLHSHVLAHTCMNSPRASHCHIKASHKIMNSLTASHHHIKAYQDGRDSRKQIVIFKKGTTCFNFKDMFRCCQHHRQLQNIWKTVGLYNNKANHT